jgi:hypothetical protein
VSDDLRSRLLGSGFRDPGCDAGFEILDQFAEALLRGDDVARLFPEVIAHLESCLACKEDTEGLIASLRALSPPDVPE